MIKFNKEQENIIKNIEGAYLINAPVGTGKTTVLTERIVRAIDSGIGPDEILALTFTNRAADEMKDRIKERIEDKNDYDSLTIKTFHGFCAHFVRSECKEINVPSDFLIIDEDEQVDLAKDILTKSGNIFFEHKREILKLLNDFYNYKLTLLQKSIGHKVLVKKISSEIMSFGREYEKAMIDQGFLDFNELALLTLKALVVNREINKKWSNRFKLIQLDEFQDTHLVEYLIIKELAKKHKNIAFIGDIDQTIYSFRDSRPVFISNLFKSHFEPVKELSLSINYRSSAGLIGAFMSTLANMEDSKTKNLKIGVSDSKESKDINIFRAYNFEEEILWITETIKELKKDNPKAKIAVLNRVNKSIELIAEVFSKKGIAFLTVDQYDFFRRQEIKDIFSYLKIICNKSDISSSKRMLKRPGRSIGEETIRTIEKDGERCGLNLSDFLSFNNYKTKEPFDDFITTIENDRVVVLDTETTGVNPAKNDIIQIYAREIIKGERGGEFHFYLKTDQTVGSSYFVHKISDDFLQKEGKDSKLVFKNLKDFIGKSKIVGHNVLFDLNMIEENAKRRGVSININGYYDTLDLARRFLNLDSYKLGSIAKKLNFQDATHSADDDVAATIDLLLYLKDKVKERSQERLLMWSKYKNKFIKISSSIDNWNSKSEKLRPDIFLTYLWKESGLEEYYKKDDNYDQRLNSIKTLITFFKNRDDKNLTPKSSLRNLIHFSSLVKNIDFLGLDQGKIPVVTIHQVKGLEFDYIFLPKMNEGQFPFFKSDNIEEEKRLFYVALTRAKKKVFLSYSSFNEYNDKEYPASKSRLLNLIDDDYINKIG
jgi:DNA helicase II / ATP-dependent DNA helicase PcrA